MLITIWRGATKKSTLYTCRFFKPVWDVFTPQVPSPAAVISLQRLNDKFPKSLKKTIASCLFPSEHIRGNTCHAFPVVHSGQILLELFAHMEVHVVVFEGAEGFDDDVVPVVRDVLVRLQQGGDFPDGNVDICNRWTRKARNEWERGEKDREKQVELVLFYRFRQQNTGEAVCLSVAIVIT